MTRQRMKSSQLPSHIVPRLMQLIYYLHPYQFQLYIRCGWFIVDSSWSIINPIIKYSHDLRVSISLVDSDQISLLQCCQASYVSGSHKSCRKNIFNM